MYGDITLCDYSEPTSSTTVQGYDVHVNAAWVKITKKDAHGRNTNDVVFNREAIGKDANDWYDEKHVAIVNALHQLEKALLAAINQ